MIVGFDCNPKKESRIEGPLDGVGRPPVFNFPTPFLSDRALGRELLTAANTTLAKEIPDVEPRNRGSDVPCTDTMPIFETSLSNLSASSCLCSLAPLTDGAVAIWLSLIPFGMALPGNRSIECSATGFEPRSNSWGEPNGMP